MSNLEFDKKVEYIFESLNDSFNIDKMLLNSVEFDEFKQAIQKGLDKYYDDQDKGTIEDIEMPIEISLSLEQFEQVESVLEKEYSLNTDTCDCGEWIVYLDGLGYFTLSNSCRKSNGCPSGMQWCVDDVAYIYDKSIYEEGYDWNNISLLYTINNNQVKRLREIANETLRRQKGYDEYGEEL